jgi:hypothetical protein
MSRNTIPATLRRFSVTVTRGPDKGTNVEIACQDWRNVISHVSSAYGMRPCLSKRQPADPEARAYTCLTGRKRVIVTEIGPSKEVKI